MVQYPGKGGSSLFGGVGVPLQEIHVPLDANVVLELTSSDYAYSFTIKQHDIREIAIPDLKFAVELQPSRAGSFELTGEELCGDPHPALQGRLIIEPQAQFLKWLSKTSSAVPSRGPRPVMTTRKEL